MKMRLVVVVAVGLLVAADETKDENKKDIERFQGTWVFQSVDVEGQPAPIEALKGSKLIIDGNKFTMKEGEEVSHGTYTIDATKKPKTMDAVFTDGPEKGKTILGIYELEGDTYKACFNVQGKDRKERPSKFESKKGSGFVVEVLKREKK